MKKAAEGGGVSAHEARAELAVRKARRDFLAFLRLVWWMPQPLRLGRHTVAIADRLTRAVADWREGRSTYLMINTPHRHGKSDIMSRAFPAWFLGVNADRQPSAIMSGYGASLVESFSARCRAIVESPAYGEIFPGVRVDPKRNAAASWGIEGSAGTVTVVGLGGSLTGKGGNLIVLDDYCKNREEAYSETVREKTWGAFSADLMTRHDPPAHIVAVIATAWHPDDVCGRIAERMKRDPSFPRFEVMRFPARKSGPDGWETLFPEMYGPEWYADQRALLGPTMAAALLDCSPVGESNRMFKPEWLHTYGTAPERRAVNVYILVDSANAKRKSSDYTTMLAVGWGADRNYYVLDGVHDRLSLSERTDALFALVERWDPLCTFWAQVGAMSDAEHVRLEQDRRSWHFPVVSIAQRVPKTDRVRWLQPTFEAGRMWWPNRLMRSSVDGGSYDLTRDFAEDEFANFPACAHDDIIDCLANVHHPQVVAATSFPVPFARQGESSGKIDTSWNEW